MVVKFYKTTDDKNSLSKNLTEEKQITGHLKDNCNVLNPVIIFNYDANLLAFNYCRIDNFNRFYYVEGFNIIGKTIEITLHVDVLTTYANDIKNSYATITRSNNGNKYLNDNRVSKCASYTQIFRKLGTGLARYNSYMVIVGGRSSSAETSPDVPDDK